MKIVFENEFSNEVDTFSIDSYEHCKKIIFNRPISSIPLHANFFSNETVLTCSKLQEIKGLFNSRNINLITIYTSSKETAISAKALKINTHYESPANKLSNTKSLLEPNNDDLSHKGTIRSGDKISSNGNLFIIGDVNPGAQISAKKNIYVWGKLCGIAIAGKDGDNNSTIASLYLNPLQLRINKSVAIGPKERPSNYYPEIALLEQDEIVIKPLLIS